MNDIDVPPKNSHFLFFHGFILPIQLLEETMVQSNHIQSLTLRDLKALKKRDVSAIFLRAVSKPPIGSHALSDHKLLSQRLTNHRVQEVRNMVWFCHLYCANL